MISSMLIFRCGRPAIRRPRLTAIVALLVLIVMWSDMAQAIPKRWATDSSGSFATAANWDPVGVPSGADLVRFERGPGIAYSTTFPGKINLPLPVYAFDSLRVGPNTVSLADALTLLQGPGTVSITNPTTAQVGRGLVIGDSNLAGASILNSTLAHLNAVAATIGDVAGSDGTLNLNAGDFTVTGSSAVDDELIVGNQGHGVLNINGNAKLNVVGAAGNIVLGKQASGFGAVTVAGVGSQLTSIGQLVIGEQGFGQLNLAFGGQVHATGVNGDIMIGNLAGARGYVWVNENGSQLTSSGELVVGNYGEGYLRVAEGAIVDVTGTSGNLYLGKFPGATGEISVYGTLNVEGDADIRSGVLDGDGQVNVGGDAMVRKGSGSRLFGAGHWGINGNLTIGGSLEVQSATGVSVGGLLAVESTGKLYGNGSISGDVTNLGLVAPAALNDDPVGTLRIAGNYTQPTSISGILALVIADAQAVNDRLEVSGNMALGGGLKVAFGASYAPQAGDSFDILDWGGVLSGAFQFLDLPFYRPLHWNTSQLYVSGVISLEPVFGADVNEDGYVNAADLAIIRAGYGITSSALHKFGDTDGDHDVDGRDFLNWQRQFGGISIVAVPEPTTLILFLFAAVGLLGTSLGPRRSRAAGRTAVAAALIALVSAYTGTAVAGVQYNSIALSGAGGTSLGLGPNLGSGVNFSGFGFPAINASGEVAFHGIVSGTGVDTLNNLGIFTNVGGTLGVVARTGDAGPGPNLGSGVNFSSVSEPVLNASGEVAFFSRLTGFGADGTFDSGIFSNADGTLITLAREAVAGPGPNIGVDVHFSTFNSPLFNDVGKIVFTGKLTGSGISAANDDVVFSNIGGTLAAVAREGTAGPGPNLGPTAIFQNFSGSPLGVSALNASGTIAFRGNISDNSLSPSTSTGIFTHANGTTVLVARSANSGPGPNLGPGIIFGQLGGSVINAAGNVAFDGNLFGGGVTFTDDSVIFSNTGGTLAVVAREGPAGPGPNLAVGVNFGSFEAPVLNAAGELAFMGTLVGTGVDSTNDKGIFTSVGGTLISVARTGSAGPGPNVGENVNFSNFFGAPVLNASGETAFVGLLTGDGVNATNDQGIWANVGGALVKIVRKGDLFDVDPGPRMDLRTISSVNLTGNSGGEDGRRSSLNDAGLLTFALSFTGGSGGIFTAMVPSPAGPGDFDLDGDVDGRDFLVWQRNPCVGNLTDWQANYGSPFTAASTTVPEPTTWALLSIALAGGNFAIRRLIVERIARNY
ncbi:beta strand repeat-containing protein [Bythopirellula polymerisocia]|uniref:PEP-CTERM motif protein n=1 Tax=Bythopirellula polymerisocia TaxID=2528003 RepID=A0A5C6CR49_9BACT|nr:choice-of-anchor tandem repeat NxxGxxAF-containing protein [Bythopirellula polymerisocia]TWU27403.1 PEP-CTERM motif protein [Bythopirellula polymerisocia]